MKHRILHLAVIGASLSLSFSAPAEPSKGAEKVMPSTNAKENATYSLALRVRRTVTEDAYVAVPVTEAIMKIKEDGKLGIDMDKFVAEAIRISKDSRVEWKVEESKTEPHEIQQPLPEGRKSFDAYYSDGEKQKNK
jgi:hypothetical protein